MADLILKGNVGEIALLPIRAISFWESNEFDVTTIFRVEEESSYNLTPITKADMYGGSRTLAYNFIFTCYVPHNVYKNNGLIDRLERIINRTGEDSSLMMELILGTRSTIFNYPSEESMPAMTNGTNGMRINTRFTSMINYEIESKALRPRLIIKGQGVIKDPLNVAKLESDGGSGLSDTQKRLFI